MTAAVCLQCGAFKLGAFTPCMKCNFMPTSPEDQAKAITLSDHNLDNQSLKEISKRIAAGERPKFDEESIAEMAKDFTEIAQIPIPKPPLGCLIAKWILIGGILIWAAFIAFLIWKHKTGS
ncbi:MAG TPA: hypothetical protein VGE67_14435 [Haloferula sp.]